MRINEAALIKVLSEPRTSTTLDPGPVLHSTSARTALRRCMNAWQRTFDAYKKPDIEDGLEQVVAAHLAGPSYRNAMPLLTGYEGIRNFIACAAQGILLGAIPHQMGGQLLYSAQVALATLQHETARAPKTKPVRSSRQTPSSAEDLASSKVQ